MDDAGQIHGGPAEDTLKDSTFRFRVRSDFERTLRSWSIALSSLKPSGRNPHRQVHFSTRIMNALNAAGVKTIGEIREAPDATLLSFQDIGASSVARLRETLGPADSSMLKPKDKKSV
jgi:DNA-directed RNA polymerase alpha subunit